MLLWLYAIMVIDYCNYYGYVDISYVVISYSDYVLLWLCAYGEYIMWLYHIITMCYCGYVLLWLCGIVVMWYCGYVDIVVTWVLFVFV